VWLMQPQETRSGIVAARLIARAIEQQGVSFLQGSGPHIGSNGVIRPPDRYSCEADFTAKTLISHGLADHR
jgi:hypothetical protein